MINDRKSYLNCMKCLLNGVKRYQILMYQKHVKSVFNILFNFDRLKSSTRAALPETSGVLYTNHTDTKFATILQQCFYIEIEHKLS